jgi:large subunit ribosomal protein L4
MHTVHYYQADGSPGGERLLPTVPFDGVVNEGVLHQVIKAHLSNQRLGTAAGKNRAAVSGGTRKPWRQKGTGRARAGSIRAAQWTGGGLAFPPQPHSWRISVPRKVRALARRSALNSRAEDGRVLLVDSLDYESPRTSRLVAYLEAIGTSGKVLLLTDGNRRNVYLSARNLPGVTVRPFGEESAYDLLWAATIVIEADALEGLDTVDEVPAAVENTENGDA